LKIKLGSWLTQPETALAAVRRTQSVPDYFVNFHKPSATGSEGRLRGRIQPAQAGFARGSRAVYGDGGPGALTLLMP